MRRGVILLLFLLAITGCGARGFDRGAIQTGLDLSSPTITDESIKQVLDLKPQLRFPFKLGVYFMEPRRSYGRQQYNSRWDADDRDLDWLNPLKTAGVVSEVIPITSATLTGDRDGNISLKSIRLAAARHGADAILVIDYGADVNRYINFSALLYLTIIGGYIVPGTHANALVIVSGSLWDVRNEYLYMSVESEAEARKMGPSFLLKNEDSVKKAKTEALPLFQAEVVKRIRNLSGK